ncbi:MAG: hypothetical protein LBQ94_00045 [Treponema sp.]|jgi:hypothetical protein|nr:hypothetical protein [Treponema sp.]
MAEQTTIKHIADESFPLTIIRILGKPYLRTTALRCVASIFRHFFFLQYRAALLPGRIPVSKVDHPLDGRIPFLPGKVGIYLDFIAFWVRPLGFLLKSCGRGILERVRNFLETMGDVYARAAEVYGKNLSTTERPFYIGRPRFLLIHAMDPHLMCIPSLHVMVVIRTYTLFREIAKSTGEDFAPQAEELRRGALEITEAVLYIKQHSVNCISASMYAMTRFDPALFPPDEAERFASGIFADTENPGKADSGEVRDYILSLYHRFLSEGESCDDWKKPLLNFLKEKSQICQAAPLLAKS